ncbi:short chain dehydrogenase [Xylariaceae sp. FL0016]|nr:short chain dehydrogenase [Xylariaceae sp. FL0016]
MCSQSSNAGGCSGIGLATVQLLLSLGASVAAADLQAPPEGAIDSSHFTFHKTDVTDWSDLLVLFKVVKKTLGRIDHVYANAGISWKHDYVNNELDENGDPREPSSAVYDVNLKGVINTATLAVHHIRQGPGRGSVVLCSSTTGLQRFRLTDYSVSKHGVVGLMRGMHSTLAVEGLSVRVNAVAPSWTETGIVPAKFLGEVGIECQPASAVARAVVVLMADESRAGHLIHIAHGRYKEIDEAVLLPALKSCLHENTFDEDTALGMMAKEAKARRET